ncbi:MAG: NAD-dependent epimerase/dehydratase family protein, partial [Tepidisphaeraceae bacterium]
MAEAASRSPVVIAGGSGFLGIALATHLSANGTEVVILSRKPPRVTGAWRHVAWDARTLGDWHRVFDGASGVVNLVGRSVDCI